MEGFYTALVCLNGHVVTAAMERSPFNGLSFCQQCSTKLISTCPSCGRSIIGCSITDYEIYGKTSVRRPAFCPHCGAPYPWTETAIETAREFIHLDDSFSCEERTSLIAALKETISETPKTKLAIFKIKKLLKKASETSSSAVLTFLVENACRMVLREFGL